MTRSLENKPGFYGWRNVIYLFIIYMTGLGLVFYGFSVIFPTMITTLQWNRGTASIAHTIGVLLMGILAPLIAISIGKLGTRKTIFLGLSSLLIALVLLGTVTTQIWQWTILWGIVVAFGFAFCGLIPIQTMLMYWFNTKRATAIGIVMTGAAVGGFLAQPYYTWLMEVSQTWRAGWLNGALFVLIGLVLSFFLVDKPEEIGQHPDGTQPGGVQTAKHEDIDRTRTYRTDTEWILKDVFGTPTIWYISIVIVGHMMPLYLVTSHGVLHFMDKGFSQMQAASILSLIILGSGLARFPAGWLGDRIEPRWILTITLGIMVIAFLGIWKLRNQNTLMAAGIIFGLCYGSQLIMFPTIVGNYFGPNAFAGINGVLLPFLVTFGAVVPAGGGYVFEKTGSYNLAFLLLIIVLSVGFVFSFFLSPPKPRRR